jgi:hypothetical protein
MHKHTMFGQGATWRLYVRSHELEILMLIIEKEKILTLYFI